MSASTPLRGLILAVQFLTRIPTPQIADLDPRDLSRSAIYFPLVGLIIGAALLLAFAVGGVAGINVGALFVLITWVWITGGLHLDGLGDIADAFGAAHSRPERFHEVLKDPHTGSFAVIAITLLLIAKFVLLAELVGEAMPWGLLLVPAWARWATLVWSRMVPPLQSGPPMQSGMAERFAWEIEWSSIVTWGAALIAASLYLAPNLLMALTVVVAGTYYWRWRLGGITGDGLGASIEVMECVLLLALVVG